jgi:hypothetical protein
VLKHSTLVIGRFWVGDHFLKLPSRPVQRARPPAITS